METLKRLREAHATARVEKNTLVAELLSTVIGEIDLNSKKKLDFNEADVIAVLTKSVKNNKECLNTPSISAEMKDKLEKELVFLEAYLPKVMTTEEVIAELDVYMANGGDMNMKSIMQHFSTMNVDKASLSKLVKEKMLTV